jgi:hypothetical protein
MSGEQLGNCRFVGVDRVWDDEFAFVHSDPVARRGRLDGHQLRGRSAIARNYDLSLGAGLDRFDDTGEAGFGL